MEEVIERARKEIEYLNVLIQGSAAKSFFYGRISGIKMVIDFYEEWLREEMAVEE